MVSAAWGVCAAWVALQRSIDALSGATQFRP